MVIRNKNDFLRVYRFYVGLIWTGVFIFNEKNEFKCCLTENWEINEAEVNTWTHFSLKSYKLHTWLHLLNILA